MMKFQVMRSGSLPPDAHGLIGNNLYVHYCLMFLIILCDFVGQFWNIDVTAVPTVTDALGNNTRPHTITVDHPQAPPRSFVADLYHRTWDRTLNVCW